MSTDNKSGEREAVAWMLPVTHEVLGQTGWSFYSRATNPKDYEPGEHERHIASIKGAVPLFSLSQLEAIERERDEALAKWEAADGMDGAVVHAIRELLTAQNVPLSAFIDDHVANAIRQRNTAEAQVTSLQQQVAELKGALTVIRLKGWSWQGGGSDIRHPSEAAIIASDALGVPRDYPLGWPSDAEYEALRAARSTLTREAPNE